MTEAYAQAKAVFKIWSTRSGSIQRERLGLYWIENTFTHTVAATNLSSIGDARKELNRLAKA